MAAISLPAPGTTYGPCVEACAHRDCAATRREAAKRCAECAEPIGYERPWVVDGDDPLHDLCAERRAERERATVSR